MKKSFILILIFCAMPTFVMAQGTPPTSIRYMHIIPKTDEVYDIGYPSIKWRAIYGLEAVFEDLEVQSLIAETIVTDEITSEVVTSEEVITDNLVANSANITILTGNERDIEATIPASGFIDGTSIFDGTNWVFPEGSMTTASSIYFQIPESYNTSVHTISVIIGWESDSSNTGNVEWEVFFHGGGDSEPMGELGSGGISTPNSGANLNNISNWVTINAPEADEETCGYIELIRHAGGPYSSADTFTGSAKLNYIQIKLPVKNI